MEAPRGSFPRINGTRRLFSGSGSYEQGDPTRGELLAGQEPRTGSGPREPPGRRWGERQCEQPSAPMRGRPSLICGSGHRSVNPAVALCLFRAAGGREWPREAVSNRFLWFLPPCGRAASIFGGVHGSEGPGSRDVLRGLRGSRADGAGPPLRQDSEPKVPASPEEALGQFAMKCVTAADGLGSPSPPTRLHSHRLPDTKTRFCSLAFTLRLPRHDPRGSVRSLFTVQTWPLIPSHALTQRKPPP